MKKSNQNVAKAFNLTSCYVDDLISINNRRSKQFLKDIYSEGLVVSEKSESGNAVSYLDLLIDISSGDHACSILDKRDAFDFHIVDVPDLSGNIPTAPAFGKCISQLIRYSRACHNNDNFSSRHSMLADRFSNQCLQIHFPTRVFLREN